MTPADIVAAYANGLCQTIPSGTYELPSPVCLGGPDKDHVTFERLVLQGEGRVTLIAPLGQPAIKVYGRYHRISNLDIVGNGAECLKLGDNADDYVGNCFSGDNLILRGGTVGFFNGKFDGSSLEDTIIKECTLGVHCTGNQDATGFDNVDVNDCDLAILVDHSGRARFEEGVFANNKKVLQVHSAEVVMDTPHFEFLRQSDLGVEPVVPAPNGSPFCELLLNAHLTLRNAFYANQGSSQWYSALGNAGCRIKFEGTGVVPKARANGDCIVVADELLRVPVDYNGVVTYIAKPWPIEFV